MKLFALTAAALATASSAIAGPVAYAAPTAPLLIEKAPAMGNAGMWLVPLLAIALIALAMNSNTKSGGPTVVTKKPA